MSDLYEGYVSVARAQPRGMVQLRGDLGAAKVKAALAGVGAAVPEARRIAGGAVEAAWMSPDELLLMTGAGEGPALAQALGTALKGVHHLALDVSDLRAGFVVTGARVREVLAKLTPADVARLPVGEMRRSRLGQVAAAFWLVSETEARVIAFRSVADYLFLLLSHAARPGSEI